MTRGASGLRWREGSGEESSRLAWTPLSTVPVKSRKTRRGAARPLRGCCQAGRRDSPGRGRPKGRRLPLCPPPACPASPRGSAPRGVERGGGEHGFGRHFVFVTGKLHGKKKRVVRRRTRVKIRSDGNRHVFGAKALGRGERFVQIEGRGGQQDGYGVGSGRARRFLPRLNK